MSDGDRSPRVSIVGGGLAGLAAAVALAENGCAVELFEARRQLGGRASSFVDPTTGEVIDNCQHVSLGCCTNLADFCRRTDIERHFQRSRTLHFITPDGLQWDFTASQRLPAPAHLGPALGRLGFLSWPERIGIARAMLRLARWRPQGNNEPTVLEWLKAQGQSEHAVKRFWEPVLVSALAESLDRAGLAAARKVFVDGFMRHHQAYEVLVPQVPLGELYGPALEPFFKRHGVQVRLGQGVERLAIEEQRVTHLQLDSGEQIPAEQVIMAAPWRRLASLVGDSIASIDVSSFESSPITGVHLWFDRPITELPHAVLVDTLSQWVFHHAWSANHEGHYYQVVISASRELANRGKLELIAQIVQELQRAFPEARDARLLNSRVVTEQHAVFSPRPGIERQRPASMTPVANLALAGDWIATGWPATMEGAVRSGYLAAEIVLARIGRPQQIIVDDLPMATLTRLLTST